MTSISGGYTAGYDAAGDMACRAPTSGQTCAGTPTGQKLTFDNEGRLAAWQDKQASPTHTEAMAYDGAGQRVALKVNGGTPTYYVGGLEEATGGTLTKYLGAGGGLPSMVRVGSTLSYLASDTLGSLAEALDGAGTATFQQAYDLHGGVRYSSGTAPTAKAWIGERRDGAANLYYLNARYLDPASRSFVSADAVLDGLDRYAYAGDNPATRTDPSGHCLEDLCIGETALVYFAGVAVAGLFANAASYNTRQATKPNKQYFKPTPPSPCYLFCTAGLVAMAAVIVASAGNLIHLLSGGESTSQDATTPKSRPMPEQHEAAPEPEPQPDAGGKHQGGGKRGGGRGKWLYHGNKRTFDRLDLASLVRSQQSRPHYRPELGYGYYFTDDPARAFKYLVPQATGRLYRAWFPQEMLDRLPNSKISTNDSWQWVVSDQADIDLLNETLQSISGLDWFLRGDKAWPSGDNP